MRTAYFTPLYTEHPSFRFYSRDKYTCAGRAFNTRRTAWTLIFIILPNLPSRTTFQSKPENPAASPTPRQDRSHPSLRAARLVSPQTFSVHRISPLLLLHVLLRSSSCSFLYFYILFFMASRPYVPLPMLTRRSSLIRRRCMHAVQYRNSIFGEANQWHRRNFIARTRYTEKKNTYLDVFLQGTLMFSSLCSSSRERLYVIVRTMHTNDNLLANNSIIDATINDKNLKN